MHRIECPKKGIINIKKAFTCNCNKNTARYIKNKCNDKKTCKITNKELKCNDLTLEYSCINGNKVIAKYIKKLDNDVEYENKLQVTEQDMEAEQKSILEYNKYNHKNMIIPDNTIIIFLIIIIILLYFYI